MQNEFDLAFYGDDEGGVGFFKKLKKAFRKVEKKVNKARRKLHRKILPKKVANRIEKIEKNKTIRKIGKVAAIAVGGYFAAPLALSYLKAGAGKFGAKFLTKKAAVSFGKKQLITRGAKKFIKLAKPATGAASKYYFQKKINTYAQRTQLDAEKKAALIRANNANIRVQQEIARDPRFKEVYNSLIQRGFTAEQALQEWSKSKAFRSITVPRVARTIKPLIEQNLINNGIPRNVARREAISKSYEMADDEVKKQSGNSTALLTVAVIGAALAIGG